jgi:pimeloyl-ACP methyl ester carboxylesterase
MIEPEITNLTLHGYAGQPLPNRFFRQAEASPGLAILFPGLYYSCDMPLLYFPTRLVLQRGMDVLHLNLDYARADFQSASHSEQAKWMGADVQAGFQAGLSLRNYPRIVLVGKSIGTLALAHLLSPGSPVKAHPDQIAALWLTPLLHQAQVVTAALESKAPALFVVGTADRTYDPLALERIRAATSASVLILEGANHSLEIPGDIQRSLRFQEDILQAIDQFLTSVLPESF